ncbi:YhgE/Pip domain-containing protein [Cohnella sp. WQ 127256]|uniref:YhgE/Pip domain-containing protein n=1 Tax=Cohnella sp. WQ 127256 TaxID=2938790 RepID=UPI002117CB22|nr:YhgE/Pip domain-containing protein [Cohnella sp. WQ 127256]
MQPFQVFKQAFNSFVKQPMLVISFVAVALIPSLYSGFLIKGAWDPYGQLSSLPVAVVNLDQGATADGKALNVGQEFVEELKKNTSFEWDFVSADEAEQGMKGNHYYASLTIPVNFSEEAASLTSEHPKQAEIIFESNSYYNYVAGQISENATRELKDKLSQNMTETYSRSIYKQFEALSSGLSTASDGALDLNKGAIQLGDGVTKLKGGISDLASGANQINSKVSLLLDGATKVGSGASQVKSAASDLSAGAQKLSAAGLKLQEGALKAEQGSTVLRSGIQSTKEGADQLTAGLKSSVSGLEQLQSGLEASVSANDGLSTGSAQVAAGLKKVMDSNADLAADPELQKLLAASQEVSKGTKALLTGQKKLLTGSKAVVTGQQKLQAGSQALSSGQSQLFQGVSDLQAGQKQLTTGLKQFNTSFTQIVSGSSKLAQGASQVNGGASQLHTGVGQMADGIKKVANGATQLNSGAVPLVDGVVKLVDGTHELASKLKDAAEKSSVKANDEMISMLAQPVTIVSNNERKVSLYGNGIAPYFISMALFAGALVFTTIVSARSTIVDGARGIPLFISKTLTFGLISLAQSLVAVTILVFLLGMKVQSIPLFYMYTVLVGFTFMFIIQAIVTWLDLPGRFVVLLLMIFQLASSAGTFPLELLPGWAKAMNPLLPMTYSIRGFRDVINSGDYSDMWHQVARLAAYLIVFLALTLIYFLRKTKEHTEEQLMPVKV